MSGKILTFFRKHKFLAAVLVVVLLVSGLIIFLHSPPGRSIVFSRIQSILKNNYEMNLTAGSLQYNLLNLSATLEKVRLEGNNQAIPVETFTSDYIRVNMGIRTFFSGVLHFQDIQIIRPEVKFHPPPETESSGETQAEAGLVRIRIDNLNLDQGRIAFESEPVSFYAVLSGIRLDVGFDPVTRTHAGLFSSENGRIDVQENQFHVDHIHLPFRFDSRSFEIQDFQLSSPILTFKAAGRVDEYQTSPDFDLNFSAAVEPQAAAEKLYLNQNFSGLIRLDGRLYSTPAGPGLDGHLTAEGFTAGELTVSSLLVEMSYQPSRIDLNQLVMSSRYGDITAEGVWFPGAEDTSRITLNWNKLHPMQILNRMSSHSIPLNTESRGHVQADRKSVV
jgi:autotransporter translocation and assembly factor TamB